MKKIYFLIIPLLSSSLVCTAGMMSPDDVLWDSIQCDGRKVDLMVNHRTVEQATLFIEYGDSLEEIKLNEACYSDLKCINYNDSHAVHFVESSCGNAYEIYWVVDVNSFKKYDLNYRTAKKLGLVDY